MTRVLFVCLGNICRSPLAEAVFNHHLKHKGLEAKMTADSCGTANYHIGEPPDVRTIRNAEKNGVSIFHRCRQFTEADFENFDLIVPMDKSNLNHLLQMAGEERHSGKVRLLRSFDPMGEGDVPDPYYGTEKDFQLVFDILDRSTSRLLEYLVKA